MTTTDKKPRQQSNRKPMQRKESAYEQFSVVRRNVRGREKYRYAGIMAAVQKLKPGEAVAIPLNGASAAAVRQGVWNRSRIDRISIVTEVDAGTLFVSRKP